MTERDWQFIVKDPDWRGLLIKQTEMIGAVLGMGLLLRNKQFVLECDTDELGKPLVERIAGKSFIFKASDHADAWESLRIGAAEALRIGLEILGEKP